MKYQLLHRGTVIKTFESSEMEPTEFSELKRLSGEFFTVQRAQPDKLPPMPDDFDNLAVVRFERQFIGRSPSSWRNYTPSWRAASHR